MAKEVASNYLHGSDDSIVVTAGQRSVRIFIGNFCLQPGVIESYVPTKVLVNFSTI
jgi:hypothetical protein